MRGLPVSKLTRRWRRAVPTVLSLVALLSACEATVPSAVPPSMPTRFAILYNDDQFCPLAGGYDITFIIDPNAADPVLAVTDTGLIFRTRWPLGFTGGTEQDPVVRDASGQVVARDGERLALPQHGLPNLHGHSVCFGGDSIWVLSEAVPRI
jgi:hypothetical protein